MTGKALRKKPSRMRVTRKLVDMALDKYCASLDFGHLAGPWNEHVIAMGKALRVALSQAGNGEA